MTKTNAAEPVQPAVETAPDAFPMTLDEFCAERSNTDRRVELLGAFHSDERAAGRLKDLAAAYAVRLEQFAGRPA